MSYTGPLTMDERLFIHCYYTTLSRREIAEYLQIPFWTVKTYLDRSNLRLTKQQIAAKNSRIHQLKNNSAQFDAFILANYDKIPAKRIGSIIGKTGGFVTDRYKFLNLVVPAEIKEKFKADSLIKKGSVPPNKGKKLSAEMRAKLEPTFFKKGNVPINTVPIGTERITDDGYIEIKVDNVPMVKNWKLKHRIVWEQHNGAIPKGYNVQFKDGNTQNVVIDNLYIISRSDQLKKNGYTPEALAKRFLNLTQVEVDYMKSQNPALLNLVQKHYLLKREIKQHENK
ncbi:HNH endonuclease [Paenimyroides ummariense]|uniref:HNH endonuclease n=1 Tax=Paenimyroides ummariense TaxID=913024 RepID=A0A1I5E1T0_9FLAO|nr:HNH endonuclease signature motif containing protein [Paenimyroides ummariense]SFO05465.1 HNH endonuclease [Paenimyroides ummariense]